MTEPREDPIDAPDKQEPDTTTLPPQVEGDDAENPDDGTETDDEDDQPSASDAAMPKGRVMASYMGRITLRDPDPNDVSRANRPLEPDEQSGKTIEAAITKALAELGFAVRVELTRTDK